MTLESRKRATQIVKQAGYATGGATDGKWIKGAVKHPGAFTEKAHRAGKGVQEYAKEKAHAPGALGRQARLARTFSKMAHGKKS